VKDSSGWKFGVARGQSKGIHKTRPMKKSISMRVKDKEHFDSAEDSMPKKIDIQWWNFSQVAQQFWSR
jgi:hypothetical protein